MPQHEPLITVASAAVNGAIDAPPSKSYFQRAVAAALLAGGESVLEGNGLCDDTRAALRIAEALGAQVTLAEDTVTIRGGLAPVRDEVSCGESGLAIRMFAPIAALTARPVTFTAEGSLAKRPLTMLEGSLTALGARVESTDGHAPLTVTGPLTGGAATIDGSLSSQALTGLLMALPLLSRDSRIAVTALTSRPYVAMTLALLREFGVTIHWRDDDIFEIPGHQRYRPRRYRVEGDWSSAATMLTAGAIAGTVTVRGLDLDSAQADRAVTDVLRMAGATVTTADDAVTVSAGTPRPFAADLANSPDLFPVLTALALTIPGTSRITGVERLRYKESDRAAALLAEFKKFDAPILIEGDTLVVSGIEELTLDEPVTIDPHGDHRIAMAAALAALRFGPVRIAAPDCVAKSYPRFFDDLARLTI